MSICCGFEHVLGSQSHELLPASPSGVEADMGFLTQNRHLAAPTKLAT